jgi:hypothetical protein
LLTNFIIINIPSYKDLFPFRDLKVYPRPLGYNIRYIVKQDDYYGIDRVWYYQGILRSSYNKAYTLLSKRYTPWYHNYSQDSILSHSNHNRSDINGYPYWHEAIPISLLYLSIDNASYWHYAWYTYSIIVYYPSYRNL